MFFLQLFEYSEIIDLGWNLKQFDRLIWLIQIRTPWFYNRSVPMLLTIGDVRVKMVKFPSRRKVWEWLETDNTTTSGNWWLRCFPILHSVAYSCCLLPGLLGCCDYFCRSRITTGLTACSVDSLLLMLVKYSRCNRGLTFWSWRSVEKLYTGWAKKVSLLLIC